MKVLIITHSMNLTYGAAKSLSLLLKGVSFDYDLLFNRKLLRYYSVEQLREYAGPRCKGVFFAQLPISDKVLKDHSLVKHGESIFSNMLLMLKTFLRFLLYVFGKRSIKKRIFSPEYDYVYLNSSILYPLIYKNKKTIIHIRELLDLNISKKNQQKFTSAYKLICIDYATKRRLLDACKTIDPNKVFTITNPFDMRNVKSVDKNAILSEYGIQENDIVFLIAGLLTKDKGVDFVANAFVHADIKNAVLLIAGDPRTQSEALNINNEKIIFLGKVMKMESIYAVTDVLVRGEDVFCTGRTVFEALYSGSLVLLPGRRDDLSMQEFDDNQRERIILYEPRDLADLSNKMRAISKPIKKSFVDNNVDSFNKKINEIFN